MKNVNLKDFARDVERLCDFLLDKASKEGIRDGSPDIVVIEDLRETAADIQFDRVKLTTETLSGLSDYMKGVSKP